MSLPPLPKLLPYASLQLLLNIRPRTCPRILEAWMGGWLLSCQMCHVCLCVRLIDLKKVSTANVRHHCPRPYLCRLSINSNLTPSQAPEYSTSRHRQVAYTTSVLTADIYLKLCGGVSKRLNKKNIIPREIEWQEHVSLESEPWSSSHVMSWVTMQLNRSII